MKKGMLTIGVTGLGVLFFLAAIAGAQSAPPIKLGVNESWDYPGGQGAKRGAEMAIKAINESGGLLGRKVEGVFYDNKVDPNEAKNATERLLYKDKVDAITGFWRSDLAIVCQPLIMEAKKLMLIGGASTPVATYERIKQDYKTNKYTFTTMVNTYTALIAYQQGIEEGLKLGLNKIAMVVEKAAWCDPLFDEWMKKYASKIVYSTRFSTTATDFSVEFAQVKAKGADIMVFVTTGRGGTPSVKQWYDMKIPAIYVGYSVDAQDPNFPQITEKKCLGVVTEKIGGVSGLPITPKSIPYINEYKKVYGEFPIAYTNGVAYDMVMAWAHGVKLAGAVDADAVVKAMERKDFKYEGVCGEIEYFDEIHNPVGGGWGKGEPWGWVAYQWGNDGKPVVFWPKKYKTGNMMIPDWIKGMQKK
ncbi:MAG: ABC transporter substrate-binding protein [Thermodesulfobacteriota bacterium]